MVRLFNTLTRKKEECKPLDPREVKIYTCGPTVYDYAHIGNMRAYIFSDLLKRVLALNDYKIKHIINITDVGHLTGDRDMGEDKLEKAAQTSQKNAWQIASYYTDAFLKNLDKLNILLPDKFPKATDHIKDMIELIKTLEKKGYTYQTTDGVYFDTSKLDNYGKLAKLDIENLQEGARIEKNPEKKNPTDFALWKFSPEDKKRDMEWKSPWGIGFPGWHIECSAMSRKYLDQPFDIHTGGVDHIPVHHTNEIAQSETAFDKPLANMWLHSEFLLFEDSRIGKSEGNIITVEQLEEKGYNALVYRYFVLQGHYRSKLNFSDKAMQSAQNTLNNLYAFVSNIDAPGTLIHPVMQDFKEKLNDDLNSPEALAVMWDMIRSDSDKDADKLATVLEMDKILGLNIASTRETLRQPLPEEVENLVQKRNKAREKENWDEADKLREKIKQQDYIVMDTEHGSIVRKAITKSG